MFNKISIVALALIAPLANALTIDIPTNPTSGGSVTINWTFSNSDPGIFSLELVNTVFHNSFAIANNVPATQQTLTITLPIVPVGDGYTLSAVGVSNINDVIATSGDFAIGPTSATTVTSVTNASSTTSQTKSASASGSGSASSVVSVSSTTSVSIITLSTVASSGFGTTVSASSIPATSTAPGSATNSAAAPTTSPNAAVSALKMTGNVGACAAVLLSAVAGAVILL